MRGIPWNVRDVTADTADLRSKNLTLAKWGGHFRAGLRLLSLGALLGFFPTEVHADCVDPGNPPLIDPRGSRQWIQRAETFITCLRQEDQQRQAPIRRALQSCRHGSGEGRDFEPRCVRRVLYSRHGRPIVRGFDEDWSAITPAQRQEIRQRCGLGEGPIPISGTTFLVDMPETAAATAPHRFKSACAYRGVVTVRGAQSSARRAYQRHWQPLNVAMTNYCVRGASPPVPPAGTLLSGGTIAQARQLGAVLTTYRANYDGANHEAMQGLSELRNITSDPESPGLQAGSCYGGNFGIARATGEAPTGSDRSKQKQGRESEDENADESAEESEETPSSADARKSVIAERYREQRRERRRRRARQKRQEGKRRKDVDKALANGGDPEHGKQGGAPGGVPGGTGKGPQLGERSESRAPLCFLERMKMQEDARCGEREQSRPQDDLILRDSVTNSRQVVGPWIIGCERLTSYQCLKILATRNSLRGIAQTLAQMIHQPHTGPMVHRRLREVVQSCGGQSPYGQRLRSALEPLNHLESDPAATSGSEEDYNDQMYRSAQRLRRMESEARVYGGDFVGDLNIEELGAVAAAVPCSSFVELYNIATAERRGDETAACRRMGGTVIPNPNLRNPPPGDRQRIRCNWDARTQGAETARSICMSSCRMYDEEGSELTYSLSRGDKAIACARAPQLDDEGAQVMRDGIPQWDPSRVTAGIPPDMALTPSERCDIKDAAIQHLALERAIIFSQLPELNRETTDERAVYQNVNSSNPENWTSNASAMAGSAAVNRLFSYSEQDSLINTVERLCRDPMGEGDRLLSRVDSTRDFWNCRLSRVDDGAESSPDQAWTNPSPECAYIREHTAEVCLLHNRLFHDRINDEVNSTMAMGAIFALTTAADVAGCVSMVGAGVGAGIRATGVAARASYYAAATATERSLARAGAEGIVRQSFAQTARQGVRRSVSAVGRGLSRNGLRRGALAVGDGLRRGGGAAARTVGGYLRSQAPGAIVGGFVIGAPLGGYMYSEGAQAAARQFETTLTDCYSTGRGCEGVRSSLRAMEQSTDSGAAFKALGIAIVMGILPGTAGDFDIPRARIPSRMTAGRRLIRAILRLDGAQPGTPRFRMLRQELDEAGAILRAAEEQARGRAMAQILDADPRARHARVERQGRQEWVPLDDLSMDELDSVTSQVRRVRRRGGRGVQEVARILRSPDQVEGRSRSTTDIASDPALAPALSRVVREGSAGESSRRRAAGELEGDGPPRTEGEPPNSTRGPMGSTQPIVSNPPVFRDGRFIRSRDRLLFSADLQRRTPQLIALEAATVRLRAMGSRAPIDLHRQVAERTQALLASRTPPILSRLVRSGDSYRVVLVGSSRGGAGWLARMSHRLREGNGAAAYFDTSTLASAGVGPRGATGAYAFGTSAAFEGRGLSLGWQDLFTSNASSLSRHEVVHWRNHQSRARAPREADRMGWSAMVSTDGRPLVQLENSPIPGAQRLYGAGFNSDELNTFGFQTQADLVSARRMSERRASATAPAQRETFRREALRLAADAQAQLVLRIRLAEASITKYREAAAAIVRGDRSVQVGHFPESPMGYDGYVDFDGLRIYINWQQVDDVVRRAGRDPVLLTPEGRAAVYLDDAALRAQNVANVSRVSLEEATVLVRRHSSAEPSLATASTSGLAGSVQPRDQVSVPDTRVYAESVSVPDTRVHPESAPTTRVGSADPADVVAVDAVSNQPDALQAITDAVDQEGRPTSRPGATADRPTSRPGSTADRPTSRPGSRPRSSRRAAAQLDSDTARTPVPAEVQGERPPPSLVEDYGEPGTPEFFERRVARARGEVRRVFVPDTLESPTLQAEGLRMSEAVNDAFTARAAAGEDVLPMTPWASRDPRTPPAADMIDAATAYREAVRANRDRSASWVQAESFPEIEGATRLPELDPAPGMAQAPRAYQVSVGRYRQMFGRDPPIMSPQVYRQMFGREPPPGRPIRVPIVLMRDGNGLAASGVAGAMEPAVGARRTWVVTQIVSDIDPSSRRVARGVRGRIGDVSGVVQEFVPGASGRLISRELTDGGGTTGVDVIDQRSRDLGLIEQVYLGNFDGNVNNTVVSQGQVATTTGRTVGVPAYFDFDNALDHGLSAGPTEAGNAGTRLPDGNYDVILNHFGIRSSEALSRPQAVARARVSHEARLRQGIGQHMTEPEIRGLLIRRDVIIAAAQRIRRAGGDPFDATSSTVVRSSSVLPLDSMIAQQGRTAPAGSRTQTVVPPRRRRGLQTDSSTNRPTAPPARSGGETILPPSQPLPQGRLAILPPSPDASTAPDVVAIPRQPRSPLFPEFFDPSSEIPPPPRTSSVLPESSIPPPLPPPPPRSSSVASEPLILPPARSITIESEVPALTPPRQPPRAPDVDVPTARPRRRRGSSSSSSDVPPSSAPAGRRAAARLSEAPSDVPGAMAGAAVSTRVRASASPEAPRPPPYEALVPAHPTSIVARSARGGADGVFTPARIRELTDLLGTDGMNGFAARLRERLGYQPTVREFARALEGAKARGSRAVGRMVTDLEAELTREFMAMPGVDTMSATNRQNRLRAFIAQDPRMFMLSSLKEQIDRSVIGPTRSQLWESLSDDILNAPFSRGEHSGIFNSGFGQIYNNVGELRVATRAPDLVASGGYMDVLLIQLAEGARVRRTGALRRGPLRSHVDRIRAEPFRSQLMQLPAAIDDFPVDLRAALHRELDTVYFDGNTLVLREVKNLESGTLTPSSSGWREIESQAATVGRLAEALQQRVSGLRIRRESHVVSGIDGVARRRLEALGVEVSGPGPRRTGTTPARPRRTPRRRSVAPEARTGPAPPTPTSTPEVRPTGRVGPTPSAGRRAAATLSEAPSSVPTSTAGAASISSAVPPVEAARRVALTRSSDLPSPHPLGSLPSSTYARARSQMSAELRGQVDTLVEGEFFPSSSSQTPFVQGLLGDQVTVPQRGTTPTTGGTTWGRWNSTRRWLQSDAGDLSPSQLQQTSQRLSGADISYRTNNSAYDFTRRGSLLEGEQYGALRRSRYMRIYQDRPARGGRYRSVVEHPHANTATDGLIARVEQVNPQTAALLRQNRQRRLTGRAASDLQTSYVRALTEQRILEYRAEVARIPADQERARIHAVADLYRDLEAISPFGSRSGDTLRASVLGRELERMGVPPPRMGDVGPSYLIDSTGFRARVVAGVESQRDLRRDIASRVRAGLDPRRSPEFILPNRVRRNPVGFEYPADQLESYIRSRLAASRRLRGQMRRNPRETIRSLEGDYRHFADDRTYSASDVYRENTAVYGRGGSERVSLASTEYVRGFASPRYRNPEAHQRFMNRYHYRGEHVWRGDGAPQAASGGRRDMTPSEIEAVFTEPTGRTSSARVRGRLRRRGSMSVAERAREARADMQRYNQELMNGRLPTLSRHVRGRRANSYGSSWATTAEQGAFWANRREGGGYLVGASRPLHGVTTGGMDLIGLGRDAHSSEAEINIPGGVDPNSVNFLVDYRQRRVFIRDPQNPGQILVYEGDAATRAIRFIESRRGQHFEVDAAVTAAQSPPSRRITLPGAEPVVPARPRRNVGVETSAIPEPTPHSSTTARPRAGRRAAAVLPGDGAAAALSGDGAAPRPGRQPQTAVTPSRSTIDFDAEFRRRVEASSPEHRAAIESVRDSTQALPLPLRRRALEKLDEILDNQRRGVCRT